MTRAVQVISISVTSTIVIMSLAAVTLVIGILWLKRKNIHHEQKERNEPVYAEIYTLDESKECHGPSTSSTNQAAINMEVNCSYGNIKIIKMTKSPAYDQIENYH